MSDRYELSERLDRLRAALRRCERELPLSGPVRSAQLYDAVIGRVDAMTNELQDILADARSRPVTR